MPSGQGATEFFFARTGKPADMGYYKKEDNEDYEKYKTVVWEIEQALNALTEEQKSVVTLKWVHGLTLRVISERKYYSIETVKRHHRGALDRLEVAFRFTTVPIIVNIDTFLTLSK
jgi:DNA-directed RNA polymerase specialized sigma24 family protein